MQDNSYEEFKKITDQYYADWRKPGIDVFIDLLKRYHIFALKRKDGKLYGSTFSVPKSIQGALVLGMRYQKRDGTFSEDLFLFCKDMQIEKGYKGKLEKILPEYSGTHKGNPNT